VENSSASTTLQDSPVTFPADGFRVWPTIGLILSAFVLLLVVIFIGFLAWMLAHHGDQYSALRAFAGTPGIVAQGIGEIIVIAYVLGLLPAIAGAPLRRIGFRPISAPAWGGIVVGAVAMVLVITPLASILQTALHFKTPEAAIAMYLRTTGWERVLFVFLGVVLAPVFEECVFRLLLFNAMRKWWGFWPGAIVSSLIFGVAHAQAPFVPAMLASIALPLAAGGIILCAVYARTNNAYASMFTHASFNALTLLLLLFFPQLAK